MLAIERWFIYKVHINDALGKGFFSLFWLIKVNQMQDVIEQFSINLPQSNAPASHLPGRENIYLTISKLSQ